MPVHLFVAPPAGRLELSKLKYLQCTHNRYVYYNHADPCSFESIIVPFSGEEVVLEVVPVVEAVAVVVAELVSG